VAICCSEPSVVVESDKLDAFHWRSTTNEMNFYKRGLIFATFLGCCLSLAFLAAALSTDYWVTANVKRSTNPLESDGHVFFGLFKGKRELNVGYGWRTYLISGT
jgi:clarin